MIKKSTKIISAAAAVAICVLIIFSLFHFKVLGLFDEQLQDKLFIKEEISEQVVVVAIDNESIQEFGVWPWDRSRHAQMIEKLESAGARSIGYDVTLSESGAGDEALLAVLSKYDNVVFPMEGELLVKKGSDPEFSQALWPLPEIRSKVFVGHSTFIADADGKVRRTANFIKYQDLMVPPFSVGVLQKGGLWQESNDLYPEWYDFDQHKLFRMKFFGPGRTFTTYSFADVLRPEFDSKLLNDKIVLVGATAPDLHDQYFTASARNEAMAGVEIQANLVESYLQRAVVRQIEDEIYYLLLFIGLGIICGLSVFGLRWYYSLPLMFIFIILFLAAVTVAFTFEFLISILYPVLLMLLIYSAAYLVKYLLESREKQKIRAGFSQYVAKEVVDELIAHPEKLNLGGVRRELTILFSDIRGFTSLSEKMRPEELVNYLNDYLSAMTAVIMQNKGVVDKFIGDAIMALWNAPLLNEDHRAYGIRTALLMQRRLKEFNAEMKARGEPEIKIGVGINSGEVVVGNLGSHQRFDYTAIGDDVNLASRLESLTKFYGVGILASEKTAAAVKDKFVLRHIDTTAVKGKQAGVTLFEVMGFVEEKKQFAELLEDFNRAMALYREQKWSEAARAFEKLQQKYPGDRPIEIYLERSIAYEQNPPVDFDGVFRADFK